MDEKIMESQRNTWKALVFLVELTDEELTLAGADLLTVFLTDFLTVLTVFFGADFFMLN
jgi:hypothetical protein